MAEWLEAHMRELELENVQIMPTAGHPVVYGEWLGAGPDKRPALTRPTERVRYSAAH